MILTVVCGILLIFIIGRLFKSRNKNEPPGPTGLPFIGVARQIDPKGLHYTVTNWSKQYGDVIKYTMFGEDNVVLNSYDTIYEALVLRSNEFAGRPEKFRMRTMTGGREDMIFGSLSPKWLSMKKLTLQSLKMYGPNLLMLQEISSDLIKDMIEEFNLIAESGEVVNVKPIFHRCIVSILTSLLYGRKMDDSVIHAWLQLEEEFEDCFSYSASGLLLDTLPWTRFLPISNLYDQCVSLYQRTKKILGNEIEKSKKHYNPDEVRCFIDAMFKHQSVNELKPEPDQLTDEDLFIIMDNLTSAGALTTTLTMTTLTACLVNKPDIQQKMVDEIQEVLGERQATLHDRSAMPYIEATILEILRYHTIVPLNLPHRTMNSLNIRGYNLPKGTLVFFNLWKLHHDPEFWDEPWEFKPERFMENGKLVTSDHQNRKRLIAFGAGRRVCAGEVLAKNRLFLMVTALLQHFEFLPESEDKRPSHDPRTYEFGFDLYPLPYKVKISRR